MDPVSGSPAVSETRGLPGEERTTAVELFFDLVFVYAITQIAQLVAHDPTAVGLARGAVVLAAVWYAWICFAWLTNTVGVQSDLMRLGVLAATGASFLVAVAVPKALSDDVLLFVAAYFAVRVLHVVLYAYGVRASPEARRTVLGMAPTFVLGPAALFAMPLLPGAWRLPFLLAALVVDVSSPYVSGVAGLPVKPAHFAERFGLFVIITLGESIVSIGAGAAVHGPHGAVLAAAGLAVLLAACLWWAYFDVVSLAGETRLRRAGGAERAVLARDAYTYLHYLIVAGIVGFAFGCKQAVAAPTASLTGAEAAGLCGGVALYLLGHAAFRFRMTATVGRHHLAAAAAALGLLALAPHVSALACAALLAVALLAAIAWERVELAGLRRRLASGP